MFRLLTLAIAFSLAAQTPSRPRVQVEPVRQLPTYNLVLNRDEVPLARKLALAKPASAPPDSEEARAVLAAAISDVNTILPAPLPPPSTWSTLVDGSEDILVARWPEPSTVTDPTPVLLWDDSIADTIVFGAKRIRSPRPTAWRTWLTT
jgi:hypothetical protein